MSSLFHTQNYTNTHKIIYSGTIWGINLLSKQILVFLQSAPETMKCLFNSFSLREYEWGKKVHIDEQKKKNSLGYVCFYMVPKSQIGFHFRIIWCWSLHAEYACCAMRHIMETIPALRVYSLDIRSYWSSTIQTYAA